MSARDCDCVDEAVLDAVADLSDRVYRDARAYALSVLDSIRLDHEAGSYYQIAPALRDTKPDLARGSRVGRDVEDLALVSPRLSSWLCNLWIRAARAELACLAEDIERVGNAADHSLARVPS